LERVPPVTAITGRETPSCAGCGSTLRFRNIAAALVHELYGRYLPLYSLPKDKNLSGFGMTDEDIYAEKLAEKFSYINTFYHQEPKLDITDIS